MTSSSQRYGDFVLYRPPLKATTTLLWLGPFLLLGLEAQRHWSFALRRRQKKLADLALSDEEHDRSHNCSPKEPIALDLIFWLIASTMTLSVIGLLLWPLLKRTAAAMATGEHEKTLSIFRQQFAELEQDRANGVFTDELYQQARRELERRLLEETGATETTPTTARRQVSSRPVALALAIIIPTASGLLYWKLGNPLAMTQPSASSLSAQGDSEDDHPIR